MIEERAFNEPGTPSFALSARCGRCSLGWIPGEDRPGAGFPPSAWHDAEGFGGTREEAECRLRNRMESLGWKIIEGQQELLLCPRCKEG